MKRAAAVAALALGGCTLLIGDPSPSPAPHLRERVPVADAGVSPADDGGCDLTDVHHCGDCAHDCALLPGVRADAVACRAGACDVTGACLAGRAHCSADPDDGCETELSDPMHCGVCTRACPTTQPLCTRSATDYGCSAACGGATPNQCGGVCVDELTDPDHCGSCAPCPSVTGATATCTAGKCGVAITCGSGTHLCNSTCVADTSVTACGVSCTTCGAPPNGSPLCGGGTCAFTCNSGYVKSGASCVVLVKWTAQASGTTDDLDGIWGSSASDLWVTSWNVVLRSTGDGTWSKRKVDASYTGWLYGVWGTSSSNVYAVEASGFINHWTGSWIVTDTHTSTDLLGVWGSSASDVYVVGQVGLILHSTGDGSWTAQNSAVSERLWSVWGSGAHDLYTVGDAGRILHSDGSGTWTTQASGVTGNLYETWGSSASDVYVVGQAGVILHSTGNGTWSLQSSGTSSNLVAVWGSSSGDVFVVGHDGVILHSTGNGAWVPEASGTTNVLLGVWGSGPGNVYAVGEGGVLLHRP
jgi:hypothetical protein